MPAERLKKNHTSQLLTRGKRKLRINYLKAIIYYANIKTWLSSFEQFNLNSKILWEVKVLLLSLVDKTEDNY